MPGIRPLFLLVTLLLLAPVCLAGCGSGDQAPSAPAIPRKLVLGTPNFAYSGLVIVAKEKGYLAGQSIDLTIRQFPSGLAATRALAQGEIDLACVADFAFTLPAMHDPSLQLIASIASVNDQVVVARRDKGITGPRDLRSRRIGYSAGTTGEFYLAAFLLMNGIRESEVELVDVKPDSQAAALDAGQVDAVSAWDTIAFDIRQRLGQGVVEWPSQGGQDFFWAVAARQDLIEGQPQAIDSLLRALLQAEAFVRDHEAEAKAVVSRYWGYSPEFADFVWTRFRPSVTLNQALVISLEGAAMWRLDQWSAGGRGAPNVDTYISYDGLARVAPDRVTAFR